MLWLFGPLLVIAAVAFIVWPLLRHTHRGTTLEHDEAVRALYRARLEELDIEQAAHRVDAAARDELRDELGAVLLAEQAEQTSPDAAGVQKGGQRLLLVLAIAVPALAFVILANVADLGLEEIRGAEAVLSLSSDTDAPVIESWRRRLAVRVESAPEDTQSWFLLGHAQLKLRDFAAAAQSFASAHELAADDIGIRISWLQARYLAANGVLDGFSRDLANDILTTQPDLPVVLEILAMDTFRQGDKAQAVTLLNRALNGSQDLAQQASYATALAQVRGQLEIAPQSVRVRVETEASVPHGATIFVAARPIGGGMPFAAVKRPAILVPFTVALDDLVSMSPGRDLSSAEAFEVSVRLSHRGVAMPEPNDWQWTSGPLTLEDAAAAPPLEARLAPPAATNG